MNYRTGTIGLLAFTVGCAAPRSERPPLALTAPVENRTPVKATPTALIPVQHTIPAEPGVEDLVARAWTGNPRLTKAQHLIDAAQGRVIQAGLYPNPTLDINGDELGDRTGPGGIWTAPKFSQDIVTGKKLTLAQAVAAKEADLARLDLLRERYAVAGAVRVAFYDVYALERRQAVLDELVKLATEGVKFGQTLLETKQIARLDLVQLEVERERLVAKAEATRRERPWARKRLAAAVGDPRLEVGRMTGPFEDVPLYDPARTLESVVATHPDARTARVAVERAQAAIRSAEAAVIPNVTLATGYTRQNQNQSNDWLVGVSLPLPTWNRNQGNIRAAQAEHCAAVQDVARVENDLTDRVATALRTYQSATREAEQYKRELLPRAEETYKLSVEAFRGGQFEYLRVIQAQRAVIESRLEYMRALGEAWKAAAELSALLMEDHWPSPPPGRVAVAAPTTLTEVEKR
jgi:cobalt-zinc-cadmium efflux system outer membrane protein